MWNQPELPKHAGTANEGDTLDSSLNGLMRDVDSFISELNSEQQPLYSMPTTARAYSLQSPQRQQSPTMVSRANTTYRPIYENDSRYNNYIASPSPQTSYYIQNQEQQQQQPRPPPRPAVPTSATLVEPSMSMPTPHPYAVPPTHPFSYSPYIVSHHEPSFYSNSGYNTNSDYVSTYLASSQKRQQLLGEKTAAYADNSSCRDSSSSTFTTDSANNMSTGLDDSLKHSQSDSSKVGSDTKLYHSLSTSLATPSCTSPAVTNGSSTPMTTTTTTTTTATNSKPPAFAFLSVLSKAFMKRVRGLENVRELFCANEYPESFTGQEAIKMLYSLLDGIPEAYCIQVANTLMKSKPPLFEPIHYSQKSIIQGTVFNSSDEYYTLPEDMMLEDVPTGILTGLLECYSYECIPGKGGCYSPRCPNKPEVFAMEFDIQGPTAPAAATRSRPHSDQMNSSTAYGTQPQMAWAQKVPKKLLENLSKKEIARQEAINEMIYSEEAYKRDLNTLSEVIVAPLLKKSIIASAQKREKFVHEVFGNFKELIEVSTALLDDLLELQHQYEHECVPMIGDILIKHFAYFEDPFSQYCPRVSLAEYLVKEEERNNPDFERFIVQVEKSKRMRRLAFRHFLLNPVTRMQRYPLLLEAILKKTDQDHPDHTYLSKCLDMVKKVAAQSDSMAEIFKKRVEILEINDAVTFKQGEFQDLQLTDPQRRLYYQCDVKRRSNGIEVTEKSDIHLFVFDHMILMAKVRKTATATQPMDEYRVWRRPIPLQMLHVSCASESSSSHNILASSSSTRYLLSSTTNSYLHSPSSYASASYIPLTFHHLGQRGGDYTFSCTPDEKQKLVAAIEEARSLLKKRLGEDVFNVISLDNSSFRYTSAAGSGSAKNGRVNCTVPFVSTNNKRKLAVGTDTGIFFKDLNGHGNRKVLSSDNVTQLAVLERFNILLVLADKTLKAYPLDLLNTSTAFNAKSPKKLGQELGQHVHFFQVGVCNNKELVVFKKKKNTSSVFTSLEPHLDLRDPKNHKYLVQKTGFMIGNRSSHSWFKKYKEFYIGAESTNVHFLKSKLLIVCDRGFEIIDPENLSVGGRDIPDKGDPQFNFVHRQSDSLKPLAMYRVHDKFMLCYNKFAYYVNNRNGSLVQRGPQKLPLLCEWEGNPDNIVFQHPYIIAFDPQFIEVRHVDTGDLVQIIPGDQIRLTHFHTTANTTIIQGCMTHSQKPDIQDIFYLKQNPQRRGSSRKFI
ncbi:CNH domain-containing protein [Parasitella parasitica]|nr:CNH domain-containing protein [Parasitella parasitica]